MNIFSSFWGQIFSLFFVLLTVQVAQAGWVEVNADDQYYITRAVNDQIRAQNFKIGSCEVTAARITSPKLKVTVGFFGTYIYKDAAKPNTLLVSNLPLEDESSNYVRSQVILYTDASDVEIINAEGTDSELRTRNVGTITNPRYETGWVAIRSLDCL